MTYLAFDGEFLIADKCAGQKVGTRNMARKSLTKEGHVMHGIESPAVQVYYNDIKKIIVLRNGFANKVKLTHIAMAGTVTNLPELVMYLERGGDLDEYTNIEACIGRPEDRRVFSPGNAVIAVQADGKAVCVIGKTRGINYTVGDNFHLGCGVDWVDGISPHIAPKLDIVEQFVVASQYSPGVSVEFDRLDIKTGKIEYNLAYDDKDRKKILRDIQRRFKLDGEVEASKYIN